MVCQLLANYSQAPEAGAGDTGCLWLSVPCLLSPRACKYSAVSVTCGCEACLHISGKFWIDALRAAHPFITHANLTPAEWGGSTEMPRPQPRALGADATRRERRPCPVSLLTGLSNGRCDLRH